MVSNAAQITCPNCGAPIQARIRQLIDVGQDPSLKGRLLSGSLNHVRCSVCGFDGTIATPLVYHDPEHELLLTYIPVEVNLKKDEQERLIGQLINRVMDQLPPEQRKAYLLQPQSVLTMQGLVDRVLEEEGISKEEIEAQQEKMRLFEELLQVPEDGVAQFAKEHDEELDAAFFQLVSLTLQATRDPRAQEAMAGRLQTLLEETSFGKRLQAQEQEIQAATESLRSISDDGLTRESLLDLFVEAPNDDRVTALTNLTRPALDYEFFELLSRKIETAEGDEKEHLENLRAHILQVTEEIDSIQQARAAQSASLLKTLLESDNPEQAVQQALPLIDELFLGTLEANLRGARERGDDELLQRLETINDIIQERIKASLPAGLQLAQELLSLPAQEERMAMLEEKKEQIDDDLLNTLMGSIQRLVQSDQAKDAEELRALYKQALKLKMKASMGTS
ncbi:MAG: CpXC domain-containing protein [Anaerolineales bacterium]